MAAKKFIVDLSAEERARLEGLISKGKASAKAILKARILLKADQGVGGPGWCDAKILEALDTNLTMVSRTRETFVTLGLDAVLTRKKRETPPVPAIFDGQADDAGLFAAAARSCALDHPAFGDARGGAPNRARRTPQYGCARAQKNDLKPHLTDYWVRAPKANAAFVAAMEDVLEVYHRPHNPARPLVCLDETSKQHVAETRAPSR